MSTIRAFHGDPAIKEQYLLRVRMHRAADQLIKGTYWEQGKGCAVGCTIHSNDHAAYETELGIPRAIAFLEDRFFENLPNGTALEWPERFLNSIPVGADLSHVVDQFMVWMLVDLDVGVLQFSRSARSCAAIQQVAALYERRLDGGVVTEQEWRDARSAAVAAVADVGAVAAADAAAYAAADAVAAADAAAAAYAAAYADARSAHFVRMADKLITLLTEAPVLSAL